MRKLSLFITILLFVQGLPAQDSGIIRGSVSDMKTKEPLIGVNIILPSLEVGTTTDSDGNFIINDVPSGTYNIEFSYLGYRTIFKTDVVVKRSRPAILEVEMLESALEGEAVTVTAGYFVEEMMTRPSVIGLSREEIRRFPGGFEDVVRTVSTLPGVAINTSGGRNDLLVRGGGPSENLYIINNIEVPNINHFGTQGTSSGSLSFINLDFVDNVSFSTGGFNARYGDKMSSVLELSLARGREDRFGGKLLISATQYGINLEGPISETGGFLFSARQSYLDLIFKAAGLAFVPIYTDFNLSAHYRLSAQDELYVLGLGALDRVDRDLGTLENRVQNAGIMDNTQNQFIAGINYRRLLNKGYIDFTVSANSFQYRFSQIDEFETEYFNSKADERELGLKVSGYRQLWDRFGLFAGLSSKTVGNDNQTTFADTIYDRSGNRIPAASLGIQPELSSRTTAQKSAAFLELDWNPAPQLNIQAGFRLDHFSFIDQSFYAAPRIALKYQLSSKQSIKASGGWYYQSPAYVWTVNPANKELKALRNNMLVLGWESLLREDLRLSVESYYKNYTDLPTGTIPGVNDYLVLTNTGTGYGGREDDFQSFGYYDLISNASGKAYGFEGLLQKKFSQIPCYGQVSLTYGKSEYTAGNGNIYPGEYDQRIIFNLSGGYIFNKDWEISTKFRYFTGVPYTPVYRPAENPISQGSIQNLPEEYLTSRLEAGHHLDIRVDRYFYVNQWTFILFLDVQNVYNYQIPRKPTYDFWEDEIIRSDQIGILPSIGISAEF